jgi:DNA mismatch endonuclease (patch repair protein)
MHGCFWHRHAGCKLARLPKSRHEFWVPKLNSNQERDKKNQAILREMGWRVLVIWECQLKNTSETMRTVKEFLNCGI